MSQITQTAEYKTGTNAELKLQTWLLRSGTALAVARVRHGGSLAPMLSTWEGELILPDLQVHLANGEYVWLESKFKTCCVVYEHADVRRTGIDLTNYGHYREVEYVTGHSVYVAFIHRDENQVRLAGPEARWYQGMGAGAGMIYVDFDQLQPLCSHAELMSTEAAVRMADTPLFMPKPKATQLHF